MGATSNERSLNRKQMTQFFDRCGNFHFIGDLLSWMYIFKDKNNNMCNITILFNGILEEILKSWILFEYFGLLKPKNITFLTILKKNNRVFIWYQEKIKSREVK